ncbi:MAG: Holliday junction resolvase RuvX [Candidatus Magasanikbacteria bacterium]|jgi:putative holliday junction resolvase|nr:Holliday junction resolvase RuvX [Candidatus Magasanikbacteria bacterium]
MNVLAIDYGQRTIGMAWYQEGLDVVLPYGIISAKTKAEQVHKLSSLIKEEGINKVVFGLPLTLDDGSENHHTKRIREFVKQLESTVDVPIVFTDERLSSQAADEMGGEVSRDEKAAMVILESFKMYGAL